LDSRLHQQDRLSSIVASRRHYLSLLLVGGVGTLCGALAVRRWRQSRAIGAPDRYEVVVDAREWISSMVNPQPIRIEPSKDLIELVPYAQLRSLLTTLSPCWPVIKTSKVIHALRLWGPDAAFPDNVFSKPFVAPVLTGRQLLSYLIDHEMYARFAPGTSPLLALESHGIRVRLDAGEYVGSRVGPLGHYDDLVTCCAELGMPSNTRVVAANGTATINDLLRYCVYSFSIHQDLEWTAEALARYLSPRSRWVNRFGEIYSFDDVATTMMRRGHGAGVCLGTHVVYSLVCLLRISELYPILSQDVTRRVEDFVRQTSILIEDSREQDGAWRRNWGPNVTASLTNAAEDFAACLIVTGHHLEWIALAPPHLRPEPQAIRRAVAAILERVQRFSPYERYDMFLPLSHLARALCLMVNKSPSDVVGL
jgi:hypothetical protein